MISMTQGTIDPRARQTQMTGRAPRPPPAPRVALVALLRAQGQSGLLLSPDTLMGVFCGPASSSTFPTYVARPRRRYFSCPLCLPTTLCEENKEKQRQPQSMRRGRISLTPIIPQEIPTRIVDYLVSLSQGDHERIVLRAFGVDRIFDTTQKRMPNEWYAALPGPS
jgi:hypothetical protein